MRESILHSTENGNIYLYDAQHEFSVLMHPELGKVYEKTSDVDPYYFKKYQYLKEHEFFGKSEPPDYDTALDHLTIKENFIQVQQIIFEVTNRCNLTCTYCKCGKFYKFGNKNKGHTINIHYAINLLKYIFDLKLKNKKDELNIDFYGGEPLMNIQFIKKIVETANQLNAGKELELGFYMTTNATLIHKHIHFLVDNNFQLLISLDGNEKGHSYRIFAKNNKNSFRQVIANIDMIQRDFPAYFANNVKFNAVLHNRNSVKSIYEFVYNRYFKIPRISQLNSSDIHPDRKEFIERMFLNQRKSEEEYKNEASNLVPGTREELMSYKELSRFVQVNSINFYSISPFFLLYDKLKPFPTGTCMPFSKKIFLTTQHDLLPCEKIHNKYALGKVNQNVIIDNSEIARKFNYCYEKFEKICQNCYNSRLCDVCMFKIDNLDKLDTEKLVCYGFRDQEAFKNRLNRVLSLLEQEPIFFSNNK